MFAYIKGILALATSQEAIVEANGIGYLINIPVSTLGHMPEIGGKVTLHTSLVIREQSQTLYGFLTVEDKELFEVLLGISGVGPKTALSLIGHLTTHDFAKAIAESDIHTICKVPGIGKKTAERLLLEVRDKLPAFSSPTMARYAVKTPLDPRAQVISDAMNALIHLGYNQGTAEKAIKKSLEILPEPFELPQLITTSLKNV